MRLTPSSKALSRMAKLSVSFVSHEKLAVPKAIGETDSHVVPNRRYCMALAPVLSPARGSTAGANPRWAGGPRVRFRSSAGAGREGGDAHGRAGNGWSFRATSEFIDGPARAGVSASENVEAALRRASR